MTVAALRGRCMTDVQLYLAIGVPTLLNAALITLLTLYIKAQVEGLWNEMTARFEAQTQALLRVEGVIDARLRHLEERER